MIKDKDVVEVLSGNVCNFPSFKSSQYPTNGIDRIGLAQKKENIMNSIFGHFYLTQWWEYKAREGSTPYLFE